MTIEEARGTIKRKCSSEKQIIEALKVVTRFADREDAKERLYNPLTKEYMCPNDMCMIDISRLSPKLLWQMWSENHMAGERRGLTNREVLKRLYEYHNKIYKDSTKKTELEVVRKCEYAVNRLEDVDIETRVDGTLVCSNCHTELNYKYNESYCGYCGRPLIGWEDVL